MLRIFSFIYRRGAALRVKRFPNDWEPADLDRFMLHKRIGYGHLRTRHLEKWIEHFGAKWGQQQMAELLLGFIPAVARAKNI